ncbi:hypothetical protein HPB51_001384 [Rhipicephalus microplus]|uniref:Uncharacterized protein n=1 Tax=Rhipicephalus microplus TaxID=6941 RepID=A0A9J6DYS7_RHIMP|nr:hypothetical protein HPB51_001384 [Rhipicephalus microplus]
MAPINTRALAELEEIHAQNELIVVYSIARRRRRRQRRVRVRQVFLDRAVDGDFHNLLVKHRLGDAAMFHNFMRMLPCISLKLFIPKCPTTKPHQMKTVRQAARNNFLRTLRANKANPILTAEWRSSTSRAGNYRHRLRDAAAAGRTEVSSGLVTVTSADARSSKLASRSAASSPDALIAATDYLARGAFGDCAALTAAAFSVISPLGGSGIVKQRYKGPALSTGCHWQQRQRTEQLTEITV